MSTAMAALRVATRAIHDDFESGLQIGRPDAGRAEYLAFISAKEVLPRSLRGRRP